MDLDDKDDGAIVDSFAFEPPGETDLFRAVVGRDFPFLKKGTLVALSIEFDAIFVSCLDEAGVGFGEPVLV